VVDLALNLLYFRPVNEIPVPSRVAVPAPVRYGGNVGKNTVDCFRGCDAQIEVSVVFSLDRTLEEDGGLVILSNSIHLLGPYYPMPSRSRTVQPLSPSSLHGTAWRLRERTLRTSCVPSSGLLEVLREPIRP
jgi:hypothetical protein